MWIDSFNKVFCSDLEKSYIGCLFKPDYAGEIVEIARAIYISKDKIKYETLFAYAKGFDAQKGKKGKVEKPVLIISESFE